MDDPRLAPTESPPPPPPTATEAPAEETAWEWAARTCPRGFEWLYEAGR